jgi:hypothetical protein
MHTRITAALPELQERSRQTHRLALELLTGEKTKSALAKAA